MLYLVKRFENGNLVGTDALTTQDFRARLKELADLGAFMACSNLDFDSMELFRLLLANKTYIFYTLVE